MSQTNKLITIKVMLKDIDQFLNASNYSETTSYSYEYHLFRLANWLDECHINPADLSAPLLGIYLRGQGWANNTRRQAGNAAKAFLRWRYGGSHPTLSLKLPKDNSGPGRYLTQRQLEDLLGSFDTTQVLGWRNLTMLALMAETGIREREICRLELDYLNLDDRRFYVMSKRGKWREGVYSDVTASYLDVWLSARKGVAKAGETHVFISVNGKT